MGKTSRGRALYTIRESQEWPIERWEDFKEIARLQNKTISALLADCILPVLHNFHLVNYHIGQIGQTNEPES